MKVYITARGVYQVQHDGYSLATFNTLLQANCYIRSRGACPVYTWL